MRLQKLLRSHIRIGNPLQSTIYDGKAKLLLHKGKIVHTESQLTKLLAHGACIDSSIVQEGANGVLFAQALQGAAPVGLLQMWEQVSGLLQTLFTHPEKKYDFPAQVANLAEHIVALHDALPDFSIYRIVRQEAYVVTGYGYMHPVHTAVMCILMARQLEWPKSRMMSLVKAALTMNMTIATLQGTMAGQSGPMEKEQRVEIFKHPDAALATLMKLGVKDSDWLDAVEQHHEQADGSGYPKGCKEVCVIATMLRIADVFTAKISPRKFRARLSVKESISRLFLEDSRGPMSVAVIKALGIYPPGELVRMASGELGVVVERTSNVMAPIVASVTDKVGRPVPRMLRRDTRQEEFCITGNASNEPMLQSMLPERLYGYSIINPMDMAQLELLIA